MLRLSGGLPVSLGSRATLDRRIRVLEVRVAKLEIQQDRLQAWMNRRLKEEAEAREDYLEEHSGDVDSGPGRPWHLR